MILVLFSDWTQPPGWQIDACMFFYVHTHVYRHIYIYIYMYLVSMHFLFGV